MVAECDDVDQVDMGSGLYDNIARTDNYVRTCHH